MKVSNGEVLSWDISIWPKMSICLINKLSDKNNWFPIMLEIDSHILNVKLFINKFHDEVPKEKNIRGTLVYAHATKL